MSQGSVSPLLKNLTRILAITYSVAAAYCVYLNMSERFVIMDPVIGFSIPAVLFVSVYFASVIKTDSMQLNVLRALCVLSVFYAMMYNPFPMSTGSMNKVLGYLSIYLCAFALPWILSGLTSEGSKTAKAGLGILATSTLSLFVVFAMGSCQVRQGAPPPTIEEREAAKALQAIAEEAANKTSWSVTYKVSGTASFANLTYQNESGGTNQESVAVPWSKNFSAGKGAFLYVSAQNDSDVGEVRVEILLDGVSVKQAKATSEYGIATASGKI